MNFLFKRKFWTTPKKKFFDAVTLSGLLLFSLAASTAFAQTQTVTSNQSPSKSAPCSTAGYKQFDFWVGDWDSYDAKGVLQGHNLVEKNLGDCVLQEFWMGTDGARNEL